MTANEGRRQERAALVILACLTVLAACGRTPPEMPPAGPVPVKAVTVAPSTTEMQADKKEEASGGKRQDRGSCG